MEGTSVAFTGRTIDGSMYADTVWINDLVIRITRSFRARKILTNDRSSTMIRLPLRSILAAIVLSIVTACVSADSPSAPPPPQASLLGGLVETTTSTLETTTNTLTGTVEQLLSPYACNTPGYGSVTRTVGAAGGIIVIGPHTLAIPPYALSQNTTITATAPAGRMLRIDFEPEGLRFERPTALTMSYRACANPPALPRVVYIDDQLRLLEILPSVNSLFTRSVTAKLNHFSGYAVWE